MRSTDAPVLVALIAAVGSCATLSWAFSPQTAGLANAGITTPWSRTRRPQLPSAPDRAWQAVPSSALHANSVATDGSSEDEEEVTFASAVANGWKPERGSFAGITRRGAVAGSATAPRGRSSGTSSRTTALSMIGAPTDSFAVIPDGGLSPCIIKVVGVGGGGCNAVRLFY
jgi:cell division protein FtsZ